MKTRFPIIIIFLFTTISCKDYFDDIKPSDDLPSKELFTTAQDLETALTGVYNSVQSLNLTSNALPEILEALSCNDSLVASNNQVQVEIYSLNFRTGNPQVEAIWTEAYKAINLANRILEALGTMQDPALTPGMADRIKGEAFFLRGMLYFEMVRLFALPYEQGNLDKPGIPLMLSSVLTKAQIQYPVRSTVQEVYGQIEKDLTEASTLLPAGNDRGRANRDVAIAYLAKVAFQKQDYATAGDKAQVLVNAYGLNDTPSEFFRNEGSGEEIWTLVNSYSDANFFFARRVHQKANWAKISGDLKRRGFAAIMPSFQLSAIENAGYSVMDLRTDPGAPDPLVSNDGIYTNKYEDFAGLTDDAPMARAAEFYLIRAESLARTQGLNEESIELLNQIRRRSLRVMNGNGAIVPNSNSYIEYMTSDFQNTDELISAIILERRVELCFEGNYFHDLMRTKGDVYFYFSGVFTKIPYDANRLRLPIPQREIDANPINLKQNPGY